MAETGATIVLATLGTAVLLLVLADALRTTLSIAEWPGPLTRLLNRTVWHGSRAITSRTDSPLLRSAGALLSALLVVVWLVLLWLGWTLVYAAVPESVVNAETGEAASFLAKAHFAASTLATAGHGDPAGEVVRDAHRRNVPVADRPVQRVEVGVVHLLRDGPQLRRGHLPHADGGPRRVRCGRKHRGGLEVQPSQEPVDRRRDELERPQCGAARRRPSPSLLDR
jgi:hypothetical protein